MNALMAWFNSLDRQLRRYSLRERAMMLYIIPVALLAMTLNTWDQGRSERQRLQHQITTAEKETTALDSQLKLLKDTQSHAGSTNAAVVSLEESSREKTSRLIRPEEMAQVIHEVLAGDYRVKVAALTSHKPEMLQGSGHPALYRHNLTLELSGDYFDIIRYLQALEKKHGMYWQSLHYQVDTYPHNRVIVEIFTISTEEALLRA